MQPRLGDVLKSALEKNLAQSLRVATLAELDGFIPVGLCDANAAAFVARNPSYEPVEGWVAFSRAWFAKHVVVRKANGPLICVTWGYNMPLHEGFIVHCRKWDARPFTAWKDQERAD